MQQNAGKANYFVYLYKANSVFCILQLSVIAPKQPLARIKYLPPKEQLMNNKATFGTTKCAEYFTFFLQHHISRVEICGLFHSQ